MNLTKIEKLTYVGCPWLFAIALTVTGIFVSGAKPEMLHGMVLICSGLICMSLFCVCALLVKIVESPKV